MSESLMLSDIAEYVTSTIRSDTIKLNDYVTTDSLLQNKAGRLMAQNLPPTPVSLIAFKPGDVLVSNIRPYLKKVWLADCSGGASQDVLVVRAKNVPPNFLYAVLLQDAFFDYVMLAPKGSRMPRGDESHIMRFPVLNLSSKDKIGKVIGNITDSILVSLKQIDALSKFTKTIFKYWCVQYDFPDTKGMPYKASGGRMTSTSCGLIPADFKAQTLGDLIAINEASVEPQKIGDSIVEHYSIPAFDESRFPVFEKASNILSTKYRVPRGAFLVSKLNPRFKRLWNPYCRTDLAICSTEFIVCRPKNIKHKNFCLSVVDTDEFQQFMVQRASSSTGSRTRIDPNEILSYKVILPAEDVLEKFNAICGNAYEQIKSLYASIYDFVQLREYILPLLLNGQLVFDD